MEIRCLLILLGMCACSASVEQVHNKVPVITIVRQLNESSLLVQWNDFRTKDSNLIRFRLFYSNDSFNSHFHEWPGQIEKSEHHLMGDLYHQISGVSSFECYIQCVKNPGCDFAVSSHDSECLLKKYNPRKMNLELSKTRNETEYGEYILIPKYDNRVVLNNLPVNQNYSFQLATLDSKDYMFTNLSEPSKPFPIKLSLQVSAGVTAQNRAIIYWQQTGKFTNYQISRYVVKVKAGDNSLWLEYPVSTDIIKSPVQHEYFDLKSAFSIDKVTDERECFERCLENASCIRYSLFVDGECCLMPSMELRYNSIYKLENSRMASLKSLANSFVIPNLKPGSTYQVKVEYRTMFGITGQSNEIEIVQGDIIDIPTAVEEERLPSAKPKTDTTVSSDYDYYDDFYDDLDDTIISINPLKKKSTTTSSPSDAVYIDDDFYDYVTEAQSTPQDDKTPTTLENDYYDGNYDDYEDEDDKEEDTPLPELELSKDFVIKRLGEAINISCVSYGSESKAPRDINWELNGRPINNLEKIYKSDLIEAKLVFRRVRLEDQGKYKCHLVQDRDTYKMANLVVNHFDAVTEVPAESSEVKEAKFIPIIRSVTVLKDVTVITWYTEDRSNIPVDTVYIEWSNDFDNRSSTVSRQVIRTRDGQVEGNTQVNLKTQVPLGFYVRISLKNKEGVFSQVSRPVASICETHFCDELQKAEVKKPDRNRATDKKINSSTITLLILIAILFVIISCYIIYDCTASEDEDEKVLELRRDETKGSRNTKYDKVATESDI